MASQTDTRPVEQLEERLGVRWPNLATARAHSVAAKAQLELELAAAGTDDVSVVVFGSLARGEFTAGSDIDWTVLVDGLADASHLDIARRVNEVVAKVAPKDVGQEGLFGNLAFSHDLVHLIGGEDDTNRNTTQRILLLLESTPVGRPQAYDRVIKNVLRRYLEEDSTFVRPETRYLVPRFLLNDFARYWRTVAVDFAYKRKTRFGKGTALRNLKLRMSRKLIYASGLLACFGCELGLRGLAPCRPPKEPRECVECLRAFISRTPLDIVALSFLGLPHLEATAKKLFSAYDEFIALLANEDDRKFLDQLPLDDTWQSQRYKHAHSLTHTLQDALVELFFDTTASSNGAKTVAELTRRYGVF